jgi:ParB family chromosome partitioning protein
MLTLTRFVVPQAAAQIGCVPTFMPLDAIQVDGNLRSLEGDVAALAESIRLHGVLEPLVITPDGRLLAGRRRLEAARCAGLPQVPVRVLDIRDERAAIEVGLIENVERTDLTPLSRAHTYHALIKHGVSVGEIARLVGQDLDHVHQQPP